MTVIYKDHLDRIVTIKNSEGGYANFSEQVAMADERIPGYKPVNKFGLNPSVAIAEEDVWDQGGTYVFASSAEALQVSSSNSADTGIEITVIGLDANWDEQTTTVNLDGTDAQTAVTIPTLTWIRQFRAFNSDSTDLLGDVYISTDGTATPGGVPASNIRSKIQIGFGQTEMAIYSVARNKKAYIYRYYFASGRNNASLTYKLKVKEFGGVFRVRHNGESFRDQVQHNFAACAPLMIPEKSDILLTGEFDAGSGAVAGGFDLYIEDQTIE
jgi:hypothetical protein